MIQISTLVNRRLQRMELPPLDILPLRTAPRLLNFLLPQSFPLATVLLALRPRPLRALPPV